MIDVNLAPTGLPDVDVRCFLDDFVSACLFYPCYDIIIVHDIFGVIKTVNGFKYLFCNKQSFIASGVVKQIKAHKKCNYNQHRVPAFKAADKPARTVAIFDCFDDISRKTFWWEITWITKI